MQHRSIDTPEDDDEWPEWAVFDADRTPSAKAWLTWACVLVLTLGPAVGYLLARSIAR
jgi:hypothetical protein